MGGLFFLYSAPTVSLVDSVAHFNLDLDLVLMARNVANVLKVLVVLLPDGFNYSVCRKYEEKAT